MDGKCRSRCSEMLLNAHCVSTAMKIYSPNGQTSLRNGPNDGKWTFTIYSQLKNMALSAQPQTGDDASRGMIIIAKNAIESARQDSMTQSSLSELDIGRDYIQSRY